MTVSVCLITYNHEHYIDRALRGVEQQRDCRFNVVIADDASKDGTRDLVTRFAETSAVECHILPATANLGITRNLGRALDACDGEYVALLEGDDYWTAPAKLARQSEYLDHHPESAMCFHPVWGVDEFSRLRSPSPWPRLRRSTFTLEDLLTRGNFLPTSSVMFRRGLFGPLPEWFFSHWIGDLPLHALNAERGDIGFLDEALGTYRVHPGGAFSAARQEVRVKELIDVYRELAVHLRDPKHQAMANAMQTFLAAAESARLKQFAQARRLGRRRATMAPWNQQSVKALAILLAPDIYRALSELKQQTVARR